MTKTCPESHKPLQPQPPEWLDTPVTHARCRRCHQVVAVEDPAAVIVRYARHRPDGK